MIIPIISNKDNDFKLPINRPDLIAIYELGRNTNSYLIKVRLQEYTYVVLAELRVLESLRLKFRLSSFF